MEGKILGFNEINRVILIAYTPKRGINARIRKIKKYNDIRPPSFFSLKKQKTLINVKIHRHNDYKRRSFTKINK